MNAMILLIENKRIIGKFKDECSSKIITGFIGLRPKTYAFKIHNENKKHTKCKRTAKHVVRRQLTYAQYDRVLKTNEVIHKSFDCIR